MLKITMVSVGSLPKGPFNDLGADFATRLKKFAEVEFKTVKTDDRLGEAIPKDSFVIVLEATGKQFTSEAFAAKLQSWIDDGRKLAIVFGGPHGVSAELKHRADLLLSLSPMTTTHDLAHIFFLEQLYRAFTITKGMEYHY
ncbi:MAG: Ribosomal RNA large subunit methyltransferase H [Nitrosomonadaceae bacterium]|nr:Ribosomal RNA large subunit methyltransferase H [Nitrosomonadaceae bacterium]